MKTLFLVLLLVSTSCRSFMVYPGPSTYIHPAGEWRVTGFVFVDEPARCPSTLPLCNEIGFGGSTGGFANTLYIRLYVKTVGSYGPAAAETYFAVRRGGPQIVISKTDSLDTSMRVLSEGIRDGLNAPWTYKIPAGDTRAREVCFGIEVNRDLIHPIVETCTPAPVGVPNAVCDINGPDTLDHGLIPLGVTTASYTSVNASLICNVPSNVELRAIPNTIELGKGVSSRITFNNSERLKLMSTTNAVINIGSTLSGTPTQAGVLNGTAVVVVSFI